MSAPASAPRRHPRQPPAARRTRQAIPVRPRPAQPGLPAAVAVSPSAARRFALAALGLETPHASVAAALDHHGYVQLDPINVCGRMHDLILRTRVAGYREHDLLRHLHGQAPECADPLPADQRRAFEHYLPGAGILVAFPLEAWPHLTAHMERRSRRAGGYGGRLSGEEEKLAHRVLAEIAQRGPLCADDIEHEGRAVTAWGSRGRQVKAVLERLFFHGRVLLAARRGFRRIYDLPERVLPRRLLEAPRPSEVETQRWLLQLRLRQRRLARLSRTELPRVADLVQPVTIPDCQPCFCLRQDLPALVAATEREESSARPRLLAPLDPLIYDRRLTATLWEFNYTWEVYTPAPKRVRGYYALPVLSASRLVGHVEPRADRERGRLEVLSRRVERGHAAQPAVRELARFLGLSAR